MALAFGELVDHYDAGRPRLPIEFVHDVAERSGLSEVDQALEVGAGTGQLTDALLANGFRVTALEPSGPMAERLVHRRQPDVDAGRLTVSQLRFEEFASQHKPSTTRFASIWSSDAWHWVDPDVGYRAAARVLNPTGRLIAMWTFGGFPEDVELADRLNAVYASLSPDLVRDPRQPVDALTAGGRQEIEASEVMAVADYWTDRSAVETTVKQYVDWQLSFAQIAAMPHTQRQALRSKILETLQPSAADTISVVLDRYIVVARPTLGSPP